MKYFMKKDSQFTDIVELINLAQSNTYKAINIELVNCYWQVGEYISQRIAQSEWGDKTVDDLARFIEINHPGLKGFNRRGLYRMKQFYETYCDSPIVSSSMTQLQQLSNQQPTFVSSAMTQFTPTDIRKSILSKIGWTHHLILISRPKTQKEREFYLRQCIQENYTVKELERQINSGVFERAMIGNQKITTALKELQLDFSNTIRDNYVLEFLNLPTPHTEYDLQKALIREMKNFILELGKDFIFIGEEYRIQVGNSDFKIDLLFFHRALQCMVAIELKADKFKPEYLGQLNFYLEALDQDVKKENENPSIGILLCNDQDSEVVKYALNRTLSPALVAAYQTQLPDKGILQRKLRDIIQLKENK